MSTKTILEAEICAMSTNFLLSMHRLWDSGPLTIFFKCNDAMKMANHSGKNTHPLRHHEAQRCRRYLHASPVNAGSKLDQGSLKTGR